jgi:hypothetical protein
MWHVLNQLLIRLLGLAGLGCFFFLIARDKESQVDMTALFQALLRATS